jgi:hypothetical protein
LKELFGLPFWGIASNILKPYRKTWLTEKSFAVQQDRGMVSTQEATSYMVSFFLPDSATTLRSHKLVSQQQTGMPKKHCLQHLTALSWGRPTVCPV